MNRPVPAQRVTRRNRRHTELFLVLLGAAITVAAYSLASLGRFASLPADVVPFLAFVVGLVLIAHIATRILAPSADQILLPVAGLLNGIGWVFIARLNSDLAGLQATWTMLGVGAYIGTLLVIRRSRVLEAYLYTALAAGIALLLLPLFPVIGQSINGSRIWVSIGPVNFQPGEFAKLALAVFFAGYLVRKRELLALTTFRIGPLRFPEPRHLAPVVVAWLVSLLVMVLERDLGSSLLFFLLFLVVLWVATERVTYLLTGLAMFSVGAWIAFRMFGHVRVRVDAWLDPWADPRGGGFQVIEAAFGMASGGLTGAGPGRGDPDRVPIAETDFIFATISEELGLLGGTAILIAYVLMIGSGLRIAIRSHRVFDKLLAVGLTTLLGFQAFIIIGGVIRLMPLTGVTLPFVSYGGSSLLANYILLALLIRISDEVAATGLDNVNQNSDEAADSPTFSAVGAAPSQQVDTSIETP